MNLDDLKAMDIKELKALAYDQACQLNALQAGLQSIEQEIVKRSTAENKSLDETKKDK